MGEIFEETRRAAGQRLADIGDGQEQVCITGIAGRFPAADNVQDFMEKLMRKEDLCKFQPHITHPEIPKIAGKVPGISEFDSGYFGEHPFQAEWIDPMGRLVLERAHEAVLDAGLHPDELRGSKTGVFVGVCASEYEMVYYKNLTPDSHAIAGCTKSMIAHRISYTMQLNGPAYACDTACSSGMYAFEEAYRAIREGRCERAILCSSNVSLEPSVTLQFARLGVLNDGSGCCPFDESASGYTRSEAIVALVLQKQKEAKRIYGKIVHAKSNADGHKELGITYPSSTMQLVLLANVFEEAKLQPNNVGFMEAHGTGTKVGDPEELNALDVFFKPTVEKPLLIGSVKGNIGHSEPSSGPCSIVKTMLALNFNNIVPNIHFVNPRKDIDALINKRIQVVTENTPFPEDSKLAGVNCFGFGGANTHALFEKFDKKKVQSQFGNLPRLVCFSGRTREAVYAYQDHIQTVQDEDFYRLIDEVYKYPFAKHLYRGFVIANSDPVRKNIKLYEHKKRNLGLVIGNYNHYSSLAIREIVKLPVFAETFQQIENVSKRNGLEISILESEQSSIPHQVLFALIIQLGIANILKNLQLELDFIQGIKAGCLTASYLNNELTLDQLVLCIYHVSTAFLNQNAGDAKILLSKLCESVSEKQAMQIFSSIYADEMITASEPVNVQQCTVLAVDCRKPDMKGIEFGKKSHVLELMNPEMQIEDVLESIGTLFLEGFQPQIQNLYPKIEFPLSRGTPVHSHMVKWNHKEYTRFKYGFDKKVEFERCFYINTRDSDNLFYRGHVIDDRCLFPATGYLWLIWGFYADIKKVESENIQIVFENIRFHRACTFNVEKSTGFVFNIENGGNFQIAESNSLVVTGKIYHIEDGEEKVDYEEPADFDDQDFILSTKDVYKELRLRGYHYKGAFRGIHQAGNKASRLKWIHNWVTLLDTIMQVCILQMDSRNLYVPVGIERLYINAAEHIKEYYAEGVEEPLVTLTYNQEKQVMRSKFIEMRGLMARPIQKRKQRLQPVLESYKFVPNEWECSLENSFRTNVQLILECSTTSYNFKVTELLDEGYETIFSPHVCNVLADVPVVMPEMYVVTNEQVEVENVTVQNEMTDENLVVMVHGCNADVMERAIKATSNIGFILCFGKEELVIPDNLVLLTKHIVDENRVYLLRKKLPPFKSSTMIDVSDVEAMNWLPELQKAVAKFDDVIVLAQNQAHSGILGMINCLRREPGSDKARCFFLMDQNVEFNFNSKLFLAQLNKQLPINILKDGQWGTYRHLLLPNLSLTSSDHYYARATIPGDLGSLQWLKGPMDREYISSQKCCKVVYSAINFRDLMLASGKLSAEAITQDRFFQELLQGFEFSGYDHSGKPVLAIGFGTIANYVDEKNLNMKRVIPDDWTLEDAATAFVVYATCLYALIVEGCIQNGQSILIHSGTGGIGLAALNICTYYNLEIFVTVGTEEKREYLLQNYPNLKPQNIGNSRDLSFKEMIHKQTNGRGVDYILNSLSEDKLRTSVECLAVGGAFLEIGKYDLDKNNDLIMDLFMKQCSYRGIMLDKAMWDDNQKLLTTLSRLITEGLEKKYIKPLPRTVFKKDELEKAFRYMTTGKHIGKILIKIDDDDDAKEEMKVTPVFRCSQTLSYIIFGGLGGFGLELVDWLILRGAKNVVISSRNGIQTGYQKFRVNIWRSYGLNVQICQEDVLTMEGCTKILEQANSLAPVGGIFNLAVVLKDSIFEHQTIESMKLSYGPKALLTHNLDKLTRKLCPQLRDFVIFSSVSCGRGNAGQTNYGFSNSVMERICETRRQEGLPGMAIQWGAVGDVGLLEDLQKENTEIAIGGTLQQRIGNCLEVLDKLLHQNEAIVSSIVVAEKFGRSSSDSPTIAVLRILGIQDIKSVSMHANLSELGMDSMMGVEIKQTLEREFDIMLTPNDIRTLTFAKLADLESSDRKEEISEVVKLDLQFIMPGLEVTCTHDAVVSVNPEGDDLVIGFPGIGGNASSFATLAKFTNKHIKCVSYNNIATADNYSRDIADYVLNEFKEQIAQRKSFTILSHSYGCLPTLHLVKQLEKEGFTGKIVFVDSAPELMQKLFKLIQEGDDVDFECQVLEYLLSKMVPNEDTSLLRPELQGLVSFQERMEYLEKAYSKRVGNLPNDVLPAALKATAPPLMARLKSVRDWAEDSFPIKSKMFLYKPLQSTLLNVSEDLGLGDFSSDTNQITIRQFDGDHQSILESEKMFEAFMEDINS